MQKKYSWYSLLKAGLGNQEWDQAIPLSKPKSKYDVIIIGGGGHGPGVGQTGEDLHHRLPRAGLR